MSENTKEFQDNDEIDLGQVFKLIGNSISKLFTFIGSLLNALFVAILKVVSHFFKYALVYAGALALGVVLGYFTDKHVVKKYKASMFVETNLNSAPQVYENIENLDKLTEEEDINKLSSLLKISNENAQSLKGFEIEPKINENLIVEMYSTHAQSLDSITRLSIDYESFAKALKGYDFTTHKITVTSTDKNSFSGLNSALPQLISQNKYLQSLLDAKHENYEREKQALLKQDKKIDSLLEEYLKIRIKESEKEPVLPGSGTNLYLSGGKDNSKLLIDEMPLLKEKLSIATKLREVEMSKAKDKDILSVIAEFPETGYQSQKWIKRKLFTLPLVFVLLVFISLMLYNLRLYLKDNKYLN